MAAQTGGWYDATRTCGPKPNLALILTLTLALTPNPNPNPNPPLTPTPTPAEGLSLSRYDALPLGKHSLAKHAPSLEAQDVAKQARLWRLSLTNTLTL